MNSDSKRRSLAKTFTYRICAVALLAVLSYYYTGNAGEATIITILFNAGSSVAYYGLERLWDSTDWGRILPVSQKTSAEGFPSTGLIRPMQSSNQEPDEEPLARV